MGGALDLAFDAVADFHAVFYYSGVSLQGVLAHCQVAFFERVVCELGVVPVFSVEGWRLGRFAGLLDTLQLYLSVKRIDNGLFGIARVHWHEQALLLDAVLNRFD